MCLFFFDLLLFLQFCLHLGVLSTYSGDEFNRAVGAFSEKYPAVELKVITGNHEDLYNGLVSDRIDLSFHDQRRVFHDDYENVILTETVCYVELATHSPLARLDSISVKELKNTPCILVASDRQKEEERRFYHDIIGFQGDFLFADSLHEARMMVVTGRGVMPVEGAGGDSFFGATIKRIPLLRGDKQITRKYCAFWKKDNSGYYVEEFAEILKSMF